MCTYFCNPCVYFRDMSPSSSSGMCERSPGTDPLSPQSHCSSPSISRLTYLSVNENTTLPTPNHHQVSFKSLLEFETFAQLSMLNRKRKDKNDVLIITIIFNDLLKSSVLQID